VRFASPGNLPLCSTFRSEVPSASHRPKSNFHPTIFSVVTLLETISLALFCHDPHEDSHLRSDRPNVAAKVHP